ncbi:xanthine dehydrogenase accessory protein XdhC [Kocuria massiliensis]|uniref:xanthine dehydrogenase accessory protein XdhC n=1 Tax=Kocuria massiliensis TaxID=1926282 RepID=UPI000A1CB11F|nr:xanthine dehydrogenase accessory protein XdhC [Kocuria massiliensis]
MQWLTGLQRLREEGSAGVLVTLIETRGHSPRRAGAKMLVSRDRAWDTVGGGNLEATLTDLARRMLEEGSVVPVTEEMSLNEHAVTRYGQQCCGGRVTALLEPVAAPPVVAVFGAGHVGWEIIRALGRLPLTLHLVDSRQDAVDEADSLSDVSSLQVHHAPAPETALNELPAGSHVLIMSHDHSEDLILCDAALRRGDLGSIGLIGSAAKWARFRKKLRELGHADAEVDSITCPIGMPEITGKSPAVIAVSVTAALTQALELA